jgi:hypothetical protein
MVASATGHTPPPPPHPVGLGRSVHAPIAPSTPPPPAPPPPTAPAPPGPAPPPRSQEDDAVVRKRVAVRELYDKVKMSIDDVQYLQEKIKRKDLDGDTVRRPRAGG